MILILPTAAVTIGWILENLSFWRSSMLDSVISLFTDFTVNGFPLWVILLICVGVFLASFMDAIAGGGGIISVPTYLIALDRKSVA